jgi:hypothetical protein
VGWEECLRGGKIGGVVTKMHQRGRTPSGPNEDSLAQRAGKHVERRIRSLPAKSPTVKIAKEVAAPIVGGLVKLAVDATLEKGPEWAAEAGGKAKEKLVALGGRVSATAKKARATRQRRLVGEVSTPASETTGSQEARPMKYDPLREYLSREPADRVTMSFANMEAVIRDSLPASALSHRAWWANEQDGQHVQAQAWLVAGWVVEDVDLVAKSVTFARSSAE